MSELFPELIVFLREHQETRRILDAGVPQCIVDWERRGKTKRQNGADLEINTHTIEDLDAAVAMRMAPIVRVNPLGEACGDEIRRALDHGASGIMLPMARDPAEVERFLQVVGGRARTIVQIETVSLANQAVQLAGLEWDAAYIGLNDLMIDRGGSWIWEPLLDGSVERIFEALPGRNLGFGGFTIARGGHPIPFRYLLHEYVRLGLGMSFLRRTFYREIADSDVALELAALRQLWRESVERSPQQRRHDNLAFRQLLESLGLSGRS